MKDTNIETLEPRDWADLVEKLLWRSRDGSKNEIKPYIAFRGLRKKEELKTSIQWLNPPRDGKRQSSLDRERRIIDTFSTYARDYLPSNYTDWDVLLLGRHHRLPTRLLDWSMSPYVALFFATEESNEDKKDEDKKDEDKKDGLIWCVERHETNKALPVKLKNLLENQKGKIFSVKTLNENYNSLDKFDEMDEEALIWFEPPSISPRIVNQYAVFSVMNDIDARQDKWFEEHSECCRCVTVPADLKKEVRQHLQLMNISERTIYPGLDGISRWIRSGYYDWG